MVQVPRSPVPTSPLFLSIEDEDEPNHGMPSILVRRIKLTTISVPPSSLAALDSILDLDTDSDSDIIALPGMLTAQPYPNCCRWHLTEARCRYKWQSPSICAPFSVRVASTNYYSSADGTLNNCLGPGIRLHSPIVPSAVLRSRLSTPPPALDTELPPPSPTTPEPSRSITPPTVDAQQPNPLPVTPGPSQQRWYAVTKGCSICVVQGWSVLCHDRQRPHAYIMYFRSNAKPLVSMHPDGAAFVYSSEASAFAGLKEEIARGRVEILD